MHSAVFKIKVSEILRYTKHLSVDLVEFVHTCINTHHSVLGTFNYVS